MKKILIQKITQNSWNFWTVNLIIRAKKLLSSRQIFRYAVPARTVTKNALHFCLRHYRSIFNHFDVIGIYSYRKIKRVMFRKVFWIGTMHYNWPMSAHASQAFSIAHCTDSEDLLMFLGQPCIYLHKNKNRGLWSVCHFVGVLVDTGFYFDLSMCRDIRWAFSVWRWGREQSVVP